MTLEVLGGVTLALVALVSAGCFLSAVWLFAYGTVLLLRLRRGPDGRDRGTPWLRRACREVVAGAEDLLRAEAAREEGAGR